MAVEVRVATRRNPNLTSTWDDDQHAKVTFITADGTLTAWVDENGRLVVQSEFALAIRPSATNWVEITPEVH